MVTTFEEYVAARGAALVRFARVMTGDPHRAEDLVQDVLARAYLRWAHIRQTDQPDVYVRQAIVNASRSWWRRRSNREEPTALRVESVVPGEFDADTAERDALWRRIRRLPHQQRAVLVLRYYEDLDDMTIAHILDCKVPTVRSHAMRALNTLRAHFGVPATSLHGRQS